MAALVPADVEALAVGYLTGLMDDATVSTTVDTRDRMVRLEAIGGTRAMHVIDRLMLIVQAWDSDPDDGSVNASELCRRAVTHLLDLPDDPVHGSHVRHVEIVGQASNFPDPDTDASRYQATVEINIRPN